MEPKVPILWDAHVHLPAYGDGQAVLQGARQVGIGLVSVTSSPAEVDANFRFREENSAMVRCFIGVHPSEATKVPLGELGDMERRWGSADGIGEVGLDPKYSEVSSKSPQIRLFQAQVEAASRLGKPLQVHSRDAEEKCLDVLDGHSLGMVLMHWFEKEELLERVLSNSQRFVSFGPALLYSKKLRRIVSRCPSDAVLVESDGPVSFSALGGPGGPGMLPSVAFKVAEIWGRSLEATIEQLSVNTVRFLGQQG